MKRGNILHVVSGVLLGLTLISGLILSSSAGFSIILTEIPYVSDWMDEVTVEIPKSCTLSTPSGAGETYTVSMNPGQYKNDIGPTTISIFCNTNNSVGIYAVGYSNKEYGNTEMINSVAGSPNIQTGTNTTGEPSSWAMKIDATSGANGFMTPSVVSPFNSFTAVPNKYTKISEMNARAEGTSNEGEIKATYAVYVSTSQAPGAYTGKVRYVVVHPASEVPVAPVDCPAWSICYNPNAEGVVDTMEDQFADPSEILCELGYYEIIVDGVPKCIDEREFDNGNLSFEVSKYVANNPAKNCFQQGYYAYANASKLNFSVECYRSEDLEINGSFAFNKENFINNRCWPPTFSSPDTFVCLDSQPDDSKMVSDYGMLPCMAGNAELWLSGQPACVDESYIDLVTTAPVSGNFSAQLWASNFKRSGYGFAGWRDEVGNRFGPNEIIDLSSRNLSSEGLSLYAIWVPSAGNLQNWNGCSTLGAGEVTALTDTRDNNTYAVAKLADGNCWMIENLRLGGTSPITLAPTDSNVTSNFTLSASTNPTTTAWCEDWNAACIDQPMLNADNTINNVALMDSPTQPVYSYGNYYNWYSATAGTKDYASGGFQDSSDGDDTADWSAPGSICPAGWRLPAYAGANADFYKLAITASGKTLIDGYDDWDDAETAKVRAALQSYPNNFITSGYIYGSAFKFRGDDGRYWSASADNEGEADGLYFDPKYVIPDITDYKYYGSSVRCMAGTTFPSYVPGGGGSAAPR